MGHPQTVYCSSTLYIQGVLIKTELHAVYNLCTVFVYGLYSYIYVQGDMDPAVKEALICIIQSKQADCSEVF